MDKININNPPDTNVDWFQDGEHANAAVLNRPIKDVATKVNELIDEVQINVQADIDSKAAADGTNATGTWPIDISGSASTLTTPRTIGLTGDVSGSISFDGSSNVTITTVVADDSHNHIISNVDGLQTALDNKLETSLKGAVNGLAELNGSGLVPTSQLPSYVDDVLEYANFASFPGTGEASKIYIDLANNDIYRWSGSAYIQISNSVGSSDTANRLATPRTIALSGDVNGSTSFDGSSNVTITTVVADDSHNHIISNVDGLQTALNGKLGSTANAVSASKLATPRTISLAGDVTGSVSFDGSSNVSINTSVADNSHFHTISNVTGLQSTLDSKAGTTGAGASGTWAINITGAAGSAAVSTTANTLTTPRYINTTLFDGSANIQTTEWIHSPRDFPLGTLITTNIDYSTSTGEPFVLEIKGNSYGSNIPFDVQVQGYIYSTNLLNIGGYSNGTYISNIKAMNIGGNLCFWFPTGGYWQGFNVKVYGANPNPFNRVTSITNSSDPGGTKVVSFASAIVQSLHSGNFSAYAPTLTGGGASGSWSINIQGTAANANNSALLDGYSVETGRNNNPNKIVKTDASGYLQVGYINSSNGNEANNSNPPRVWGTNGTDNFLRTYLTSALSVGYATSAGSATSASNADLLDGQHGSYYQPASTAITTSNISSQSVSYAANAGSASNADNLDGNDSSYFQPASTAITTSNIGSQSVNYATSSNTSTFLNTSFGVDLETVTANGIYREESPTSGFWYTTTLNMSSSDGRQQLTIARDGSGMKFRGSVYGSGDQGWSAWKTVLDSSNYSSFAAPVSHSHDASQITSGTFASARLAGTYNINITGSAGSASNADTLDGLDSTYFQPVSIVSTGTPTGSAPEKTMWLQVS